eukprot:CAMPEP_0171079574 /NCGR_PEP_ID=MMETSP0766_2-20121228/15335_1 /TAXON_ID=439317 /ORGANISM="Gambierdiscus australes, Strain CAWD 149" /LENGTH=94 /DNA_ID=CAMNT_0011536769 /DNA_START=1142 /DNA_END=1426 /DNA_ORIENTATION=-
MWTPGRQPDKHPAECEFFLKHCSPESAQHPVSIQFSPALEHFFTTQGAGVEGHCGGPGVRMPKRSQSHGWLFESVGSGPGVQPALQAAHLRFFL